MNINIDIMSCQKGDLLPLVPPNFGCGHICLEQMQISRLAGQIGAMLLPDDRSAETAFRISGYTWLCSTSRSFPDEPPAMNCPVLEAVCSTKKSHMTLKVEKKGWSAAVITLSDKGYAGQRKDTAGPLVARTLMDGLEIAFLQRFMLTDDPAPLKGLLAELALIHGYDLIVTTGGTGVGPRDFAPQTTTPLLDMTLPGFSQAMIAASLQITPNAIISRAQAGVIGKCLVLNLPGSAKGAVENLEAVLAALPHALSKASGDQSDCGKPA